MSASAEDLLLHEMLKARHCTLLILSVLLRRDLQRKHQKPRPRQIPRPQGARRAHSRCSLRVPGRVHFHAQLTAEPPKKKTPLASCLLRSFGRNSAAPTVLATSTAKLCLRARSNAQRSPLRPRRAAEPSRAERQSGAQSSPSMRLQLDKAVNPMLATLSLDDTTPLRTAISPNSEPCSQIIACVHAAPTTLCLTQTPACMLACAICLCCMNNAMLGSSPEAPVHIQHDAPCTRRGQPRLDVVGRRSTGLQQAFTHTAVADVHQTKPQATC